MYEHQDVADTGITSISYASGCSLDVGRDHLSSARAPDPLLESPWNPNSGAVSASHSAEYPPQNECLPVMANSGPYNFDYLQHGTESRSNGALVQQQQSLSNAQGAFISTTLGLGNHPPHPSLPIPFQGGHVTQPLPDPVDPVTGPPLTIDTVPPTTMHLPESRPAPNPLQENLDREGQAIASGDGRGCGRGQGHGRGRGRGRRHGSGRGDAQVTGHSGSGGSGELGDVSGAHVDPVTSEGPELMGDHTAGPVPVPPAPASGPDQMLQRTEEVNPPKRSRLPPKRVDGSYAPQPSITAAHSSAARAQTAGEQIQSVPEDATHQKKCKVTTSATRSKKRSKV